MAFEFPTLTMAPGPDEQRRLIASLPPHNATRWTTVRKAQVVAAIVGGVLTMEDARLRYALSEEEFISWQGVAARSKVRRFRSDRSVELSLSAI